ncbi:LysR family transcriptional regulator [Acetobacter lambici]|uniref:LysR family transcriptional regulator n=1 Tax=Acetobacter lambici TaxID=1332824 RepID=A0ABT1F454_9PROT|nr:LysR family transcriptional regulator [Acetobacter lambici]MCP1243924.1 LysR family transcriptional regulator [Acetobacter lambici]MCP1260002.1 LysR family transcriptional regulator [Acetobacter lambici]NHO58126.1 LysR family transcriptional regulator [Acetobacter lambici]
MSAFSRELLSFVEISRHNSVRRAAEVLNVASSALIRQMQMLERAFGAPLMTRTPQGSSLTDAGKKLREQATQWIDAERQLRAMISQPNTTRLRLGIMECLLPFVMAQPELQVHTTALKVIVSDTNSLIHQLRMGELDVVIAFNVMDEQDILIRKKRDYDIGLITSSGFAPSGSNGSALLAACADLPLCLPDSSLSLWPRLDGEFTRMRVQPRVLMDTNSVRLIRDYIKRGECMGFLTWLDVVHDLSQGDLSFHALDNLRLRETLCLCTRPDVGEFTPAMAVLSRMFDALPQTGTLMPT